MEVEVMEMLCLGFFLTMCIIVSASAYEYYSDKAEDRRKRERRINERQLQYYMSICEKHQNHINFDRLQKELKEEYYAKD